MGVRGELSLGGRKAPVTFDLVSKDDGRITGICTVTHSAFGMKPYSALFGALKVADEVQVEIDTKPD
jgi:hypothetical protein